MSLVKSGLKVAICTTLSRVSGFIRDILITAALGTGPLADAFNLAFRLPNFFRRIFAEGSFNSAFIPIFTGKLAVEGEEPARIFANNIFTLLLTTLILFVTLLELIMPAFMYVMAPGFVLTDSLEKFSIAIDLSRITCPYLLFISLVSLLGGILNSTGRFIAFSISPIILNLCIILFLLTLKYFVKSEAHALAWGVFAAGIVQLLVMVFSAHKAGMMVKFVKPVIDSDIRKFLKNMGPGILSGGVMQINILIDQVISSFIPGAISILSYADRLQQLPLAVIGISIGTVLLPALSSQLHQGKSEASIAIQNRALEVAFLFSIPCCFALMLIAHPIILTLFERQAFTHSDTIKTAHALMAFAAGIPASIACKIFLPCFFAAHDTKTPLKIGLICITVNTICSLLMIYPLKHVGIALSASIAAWVNLTMLFLNLRKQRLYLPDERLKRKIPRIIAASGVMALFIILYKSFYADNLHHFQELTRIIALLVLVSVSILIFTVSAYCFKAFEWTELKPLLLKSKARKF